MYTRCCLVIFFFFKQKTAYEMRISDWSSDVVLFRSRRACKDGTGHIFQLVRLPGAIRAGDCNRDKRKYGGSAHRGAHVHRRRTAARGADGRSRQQRRRRRYRGDGAEAFGERSEEHTSELQSLMRSSYAVFCLKKKR